MKSTSGEFLQPFNGFSTYPVDGSYFILYPRLGTKVRVFNGKGEFLWERAESHYLLNFPYSNWIMAVAGDHSRVHVFKPNLEEQLDLEGHILLSYHFASNKEDKFDACMGFFGGSVAFLKASKKKVFRKDLKTRSLKSIACNLQTADFVAQVENKSDEGRLFDTLYLGNIHEEKPRASLELDTYFPVTLPIEFEDQENWFAALVPGKEPFIGLADEDGFFQKVLLLPHRVKVADADEWRAEKLKSAVVFWNQQWVLMVNKDGLVFRKKVAGAKRLITRTGRIYIQTSKGLLSMQLSTT